MSRHLLNRFANFSSAIEVVVVARVADCFAGRGPVKARPIFEFTVHFAILLSDFFKSSGWWMS